MTHSSNRMVMALTISVVFIVCNILVVTQGNAQSYIGLIGEFVTKLLH